MKIAIYIDTENKQDIKDLTAIYKALNADESSSESVKRYIERVVKQNIDEKLSK